LSTTLGARYTDHLGKPLWTYKAEGDWGIGGGFRLRGSYEHAVRAPNIDELFAATLQDNPQLVDPCTPGSTFRTDPTHGATGTGLCAALGVPADFVQPSGQISAIAGGNRQLKSETADTYTVGGVWQSRFTNPWASRFNASLDYWNIDLKK